jgi:hypothetical protein
MEIIVPAWQPLTPRGVAAFAQAPWRRLLLVQFIVALCVALAVAWFVFDRYFPIISNAIARLPAGSEVRYQQLVWRGESPLMLAENRFLALNVDVERTGALRPVAHVQIEFTRTTMVMRSLFGFLELPYPSGWRVALHRETAEPFWGAWRPALLAGTILAVIVGLHLSWFGLATLYVVPVWLLGFYLNRQLSWRGSWRMSGAALVPGALLMLAGLSFYNLGVMDLVAFLFVFVAHIVLGWAYIIAGLFVAPRDSERLPKNPFTRAARK